jgi:hypothetical protein
VKVNLETSSEHLTQQIHRTFHSISLNLQIHNGLLEVNSEKTVSTDLNIPFFRSLNSSVEN